MASRTASVAFAAWDADAGGRNRLLGVFLRFRFGCLRQRRASDRQRGSEPAGRKQGTTGHGQECFPVGGFRRRVVIGTVRPYSP